MQPKPINPRQPIFAKLSYLPKALAVRPAGCGQFERRARCWMLTQAQAQAWRTACLAQAECGECQQMARELDEASKAWNQVDIHFKSPAEKAEQN